MKRALLLLGLSFALPAFAALDVEGVVLGASEREVKKRFPNAYCKPLEWTSRAADRRCDDGKAAFAGFEVRITFYLRRDALEAFDVRFETRDADKLAGKLLTRYGKPALEERDPKVTRLEWQDKIGKAVLVAPADKRRGSLLVSRGEFEDEIYKVR